MRLKLELSPRRKIEVRAVCNRGLMGEFIPTGRKQVDENKCILESFVIYVDKILLVWSHQREQGEWGV
jgi:hypothetical protein